MCVFVCKRSMIWGLLGTSVFSFFMLNFRIGWGIRNSGTKFIFVEEDMVGMRDDWYNYVVKVNTSVSHTSKTKDHKELIKNCAQVW